MTQTWFTPFVWSRNVSGCHFGESKKNFVYSKDFKLYFEVFSFETVIKFETRGKATFAYHRVSHYEFHPANICTGAIAPFVCPNTRVILNICGSHSRQASTVRSISGGETKIRRPKRSISRTFVVGCCQQHVSPTDNICEPNIFEDVSIAEVN